MFSNWRYYWELGYFKVTVRNLGIPDMHTNLTIKIYTQRYEHKSVT